MKSLLKRRRTHGSLARATPDEANQERAVSDGGRQAQAAPSASPGQVNPLISFRREDKVTFLYQDKLKPSRAFPGTGLSGKAAHLARTVGAAILNPNTATWLRVLAFALVLGGVMWRYDEQKVVRELRYEALTQYMLYMNVAWAEYEEISILAVLPDDPEHGFERYDEWQHRVQQARNLRRDAFARALSSVVALSAFPGERSAELEEALKQSDVRAEESSERIDGWMRDLYCRNTECLNPTRRSNDVTAALFEDLRKMQEVLRKNRELDNANVKLFQSRFR